MADPFDVGDVLMQIFEDILLILFSLILGLVVFELNTRVLIMMDLISQKEFHSYACIPCHWVIFLNSLQQYFKLTFSINFTVDSFSETFSFSTFKSFSSR